MMGKVESKMSFYEINNPDKLENEMILIRKYLMNEFLNKAKYDERFYIYDYKIRFNADIREFNSCLNNFIDFFRTNYANESEVIKLYNYLHFINHEKILVKKNGYFIKRMNHETNRLKQYKVSYAEILERLINFEILFNLKRFHLVFHPNYYHDGRLDDEYSCISWNA